MKTAEYSRCGAISRLMVIALLVMAACAHKPTSPENIARARALPTYTSSSAANAPSQSDSIEVRVLTVAYRGARGAAPEQARTREQAVARARMLASMAQGGEKLGQLVGEYSDRPGASEDRGIVRIRRDHPEPFEAAFMNAALALSPGHVSDALEQPEGFVVIERLKDPQSGPAQIGAKHILVGYVGSAKELPHVTRNEAEARSLAQKVASEASKPATDWNALAAQYTDEPGGKERGGDLGKFGRGQMVDSFEKAAFALRVGETSGVIRSPFGFHIIRRYE